MRKEERLFAALSGVDDELLERSERRRSGVGRWIAWGAALAACLAVVLLVRSGAPKRALPEPPPPQPVEDISAPQPEEPSTTPALPALPAEPQKLRCLQIAPQEQDIPEFTIWINEESYYAYEQNGVYAVRPHDPPQVPDQELPECKLEIEYFPGAIADAAETVRGRLKSLYRDVSEVEREENSDMGISWPTAAGYYFRGSDGTDWDSAQREAWLLPCYDEDGEQSGVFLLSASYFLEAEEGHGVRFRDMVWSFSAWSQPYPWMEKLKAAALRLTKAVMSDDLSGVEDLLAPDAEVVGPEEDLYAYVSVSDISCDYTVWSGYEGHEEEVPESASVSVQFRLGGEDAYSYLTMEMFYQDGAWLARWIGIEK